MVSKKRGRKKWDSRKKMENKSPRLIKNSRPEYWKIPVGNFEFEVRWNYQRKESSDWSKGRDTITVKKTEIMNAYIWRTAAGSNKFVCSYTGSDWYGNGTQAKPYKSLTKAYNTGSATAPIVCRGIFNDNLVGAHNSAINGDYFGAAVWDGQGTNNIYAFYHSNMIFYKRRTGRRLRGRWSCFWCGRCELCQRALRLTCFGVQLSTILGSSRRRCRRKVCRVCKHTGKHGFFSKHGKQWIEPEHHHTRDTQGKHEKVDHHSTGERTQPEILADRCHRDLFGPVRNLRHLFVCSGLHILGKPTRNSTPPTGATDADKMASIVAKVATLGTVKLVLTNCKYTSETSAELFNNSAKQDFFAQTGMRCH